MHPVRDYKIMSLKNYLKIKNFKLKIALFIFLIMLIPTHYTSAYESINFNYDNQQAGILSSLLNLISPTSHAQTPDITTGLVGHWSFDEGSGTTAGDLSGNGNDGTLTGDPTWVTGQIGSGALSFDGSNDYVNITDQSIFSPAVNPITISTWAKLSGDTGGGAAGGSGKNIIGKGSSNNWEYTLEYDGGDIFVTAFNPSGVIHLATSYTALRGDTDWHHFTATIEASVRLDLYIDGVLQDSDTTPNNTMVDKTENLNIGRRGDGNYFDNMIDDVRIYSRALTQADITELYNVGSGATSIPPLTPEPDPTPSTCTSFTYTDWSPNTCPASQTQTRTVLTSLPEGCLPAQAGTEGTPDLTQSCTYIPPEPDTEDPSIPPIPSNPPTTTTPTSSPNNWQGTLDQNFDFAETFDLIADWRGTGYGNVFFNGPNATWDYYSEWDRNPDITANWIANHGAANVWGGTGKSLSMDLSQGGQQGYSPNVGPSRFGLYFGNGTPDSGYDIVHIFWMTKFPNNYFPKKANGEYDWWAYYKFGAVSTGFEAINRYDSSVSNLTNQGDAYGRNYFVPEIRQWGYGAPCQSNDDIRLALVIGRNLNKTDDPNTVKDEVKTNGCLDKYVGKWFGIEYFLDAGTPGNTDGHIKIWLYDANGVTELIYDQIRMILPVGVNHKWNKFFFGGNLFWTEAVYPTLTTAMYVDDFIIDNQRIGPTYFALLAGNPPPPPTPPTLQADLNSDNTVNSLDWSIMNNAWGTNDIIADINNDGTVNTIDWSVMNSQWN